MALEIKHFEIRWFLLLQPVSQMLKKSWVFTSVKFCVPAREKNSLAYLDGKMHSSPLQPLCSFSFSATVYCAGSV